MLRVLALALLILMLPLIVLAADQPTPGTVDLPYEVVEGATFTFTVTWDVPESLGALPLHIELKVPSNDVLAWQVVDAKGKGEQQVEFTAPMLGQGNPITFALWFGTDWREAVGGISATRPIRLITRKEAAQFEKQAAEAKEWARQVDTQQISGKLLAVLYDDYPGYDTDFAGKLIAGLDAAGLKHIELSASEVGNPDILTAERFWGLVIPSSSTYPADGGRAFRRFLEGGGDVMALGGPLMEQPLRRYGDNWLTQQELMDKLAAIEPSHLIFDPATADIAAFPQGNGPDTEATWSISDEGPRPSAKSLKLDSPRMVSWATLGINDLAETFRPGEELTCFWAKGGVNTTSMSFEWTEQDGSRWIAVVPVTRQWRHYALRPSEFKYWHDSPSRNRGYAGDSFNPEQASHFAVGLALTHTPVNAGPHSLWIADIGTAPSPLEDEGLSLEFDFPIVEELYPAYKFFEVTNAVKLEVSGKQKLLPDVALELPEESFGSVQPRPQGTGYNRDRKWRWIPLIEARTEEGEVCGTPACLILHQSDGFPGAITSSFALPTEYLARPEVLGLVTTTLARMKQGQFLFEGGADSYAYFEDGKPLLGARAVAMGETPLAGETVAFSVTDGANTVFEAQAPLSEGKAEVAWPTDFANDDYTVTCELRDAAGNLLDWLSHPIVVSRPSVQPEPMRIRDGHFYIGETRWYPHGTNYMPSSGIGIEDGPYFEYWMGKQAYDPIVIQRDLERCVALGMNMVSVFCYHNSLDSGNLTDLLERCRRLDLRVNLSLRPGTPLDFQWPLMKELIEGYRLAENTTIFAYDLAWEPQFGNHEMRVYLDPLWQDWVVERYGSLEAAETDWGVPIPRAADGKVTNPSDVQCSTEGAHHVMVCAYRRFLDDLLGKKYGTANRLVKSLDPIHYTSFRMAEAGNPTVGGSWIAYDFRGLARDVDIMEPEGYGRIGDWQRVKPGWFDVAWAHAMAPNRPVMWAEFGNTSWNRGTMERDLEKEAEIGQYYRDFYRMAYLSGADGTVAWWYPGGFRYGENSDFGNINPDGSWRPASYSIKDWSPLFQPPRADYAPDEYIVVDRDSTTQGINGVYQQVEKRFWQLIEEEGKWPALRRIGEGLTSVTAPPLAIGNVPLKPGVNPPKYLNAEFDYLWLLNAEGQWQEVTDGDTVRVKRGAPVLARAQVGNNGDAMWIAGQPAEGIVVLQCGEALKPLSEDVPFCGTAYIEDFQIMLAGDSRPLEFVMCSWPDTTFGEKVTINLLVVD